MSAGIGRCARVPLYLHTISSLAPWEFQMLAERMFVVFPKERMIFA